MDLLYEFTIKFQNERDFSSQQEAAQCLSEIVTHLSSPSWLQSATGEDKLTLFSCLRLLLRDSKLLEEFVLNTSCLCILSEDITSATHKYLTSNDSESHSLQTSLVMELTNIIQKVTHVISSRSLLIGCDTHKQLLFLLSSYSHQILQSSLNGLINLSKDTNGRKAILDCYPLGSLFHIMKNYHNSVPAQSAACDLFLLLSQESDTQRQVKEQDLLSFCIELVQSSSHSVFVKTRLLESLERILDDDELVDDFRELGGIPVMMILITPSNPATIEHQEMLKACFSLLSSLSLNDVCAKQIIEHNGLYLISHYLVNTGTDRKLKMFSVRALRYLFSLERNRRLFKRLFPLTVFEDFINIGHYVHNLSSYSKLIDSLSLLSLEDKSTFESNQKSLNQTGEPLCVIGKYTVLELLGTGAYGSVYKVHKGSSSNLYALKEIHGNHPVLGSFRTAEDRKKSVGHIMSEVAMIHENLRHPNIVRYYNCFEESQHLYIEMSLIEGAPLSEFIASLREKQTFFLEDRIWYIFSQIICALRYLHEDKKIVHRDLKPANMILGEQDKLTITDFGLAKHHKEFSVMNSVVGTMVYWCPELVENEDYDKKADIWAAGCILYEMVSLQPPFYATNMLSLAKKIAEGKFDYKPLDVYTPLMKRIIIACLTLKPQQRPDSIEIGSLMSVHLMRQLDDVVHLLESIKGANPITKQVKEEKKEKAKRKLSFDSTSDTDSNHTRESSPILAATTLRLPLERASFDKASDVSFSLEPINTTLLRQRSYSLSPVPSSYRARQTRSGSALLRVSPQNLREIADPVGDLLQVVHKLIFVFQLPPLEKEGQNSSPVYTIVVRYIRALFSNTGSFNAKELKNELWKLAISSKQGISMLPNLPHLLSAALTECPHIPSDSERTVSYEQLHSFIEEVLKRANYYKI